MDRVSVSVGGSGSPKAAYWTVRAAWNSAGSTGATILTLSGVGVATRSPGSQAISGIRLSVVKPTSRSRASSAGATTGRYSRRGSRSREVKAAISSVIWASVGSMPSSGTA